MKKVDNEIVSCIQSFISKVECTVNNKRNFIEQECDEVPYKNEKYKRGITKGEFLNLPKSRYTIELEKNESRKIKSKIERSELIDVTLFSSKKICKILTRIDTELFMKINLAELVDQRGGNNREVVEQIQSMVSALSILAERSGFSKFLRVAKILLRMKNYNSYRAVMVGLRNRILKRSQIEKLRNLPSDDDTQILYSKDVGSGKVVIPYIDDFVYEIGAYDLGSKNEAESTLFIRNIEAYLNIQNNHKLVNVRRSDEHAFLNMLKKTSTLTSSFETFLPTSFLLL